MLFWPCYSATKLKIDENSGLTDCLWGFNGFPFDFKWNATLGCDFTLYVRWIYWRLRNCSFFLKIFTVNEMFLFKIFTSRLVIRNSFVMIWFYSFAVSTRARAMMVNNV